MHFLVEDDTSNIGHVTATPTPAAKESLREFVKSEPVDISYMEIHLAFLTNLGETSERALNKAMEIALRQKGPIKAKVVDMAAIKDEDDNFIAYAVEISSNSLKEIQDEVISSLDDANIPYNAGEEVAFFMPISTNKDRANIQFNKMKSIEFDIESVKVMLSDDELTYSLSENSENNQSFFISNEHPDCDGFAVISSRDDKVMSCHNSREEAERAMEEAIETEAEGSDESLIDFSGESDSLKSVLESLNLSSNFETSVIAPSGEETIVDGSILNDQIDGSVLNDKTTCLEEFNVITTIDIMTCENDATKSCDSNLETQVVFSDPEGKSITFHVADLESDADADADASFAHHDEDEDRVSLDSLPIMDRAVQYQLNVIKDRKNEFQSIMIIEGKETGDRRFIRPGALSETRQLPLPMMSTFEKTEMHLGSVLAGLFTKIERINIGDGMIAVVSYGHYNNSPAGQQTRQMFKEGAIRGVSADLDNVVASIEEEGSVVDNGMRVVLDSGRIMGATVVAFPAFEEAGVWLLEDEIIPSQGLVASAFDDSCAYKPTMQIYNTIDFSVTELLNGEI